MDLKAQEGGGKTSSSRLFTSVGRYSSNVTEGIYHNIVLSKKSLADLKEKECKWMAACKEFSIQVFL